MSKSITVEAKKSNGTKEFIQVFGDMKQIFKFIEEYEGNDVGNDIILKDFVTDFKSTGVIIED